MAARGQASTLDTLCYDASNLHQLARQGSWRSLIDAIAQARKLSLPQFPHEQLVHHAYLVLAHLKLRNYGDASLELDALGDLDSPQYQYEHYPDLYPSRTGSMVPFVLRWLHAELPYRMNQPAATIERLYALYDRCRLRVESLQAAAPSFHRSVTSMPVLPTIVEEREMSTDVGANSSIGDVVSPSSAVGMDATAQEAREEELKPSVDEHVQAEPDPEFGDFVSRMSAALKDSHKGALNFATDALHRWQQRQEFIISCILGHHLNQRDFVVVLKWLEQILRSRPADPWLLSKLGYVQMQMGDLAGATCTFSEVEELANKMELANPLQRSSVKELLLRNKGLQNMVSKQYTEAIKEFEAAITMNPVDVISANNKALCFMYCRDLIGSTKVLESILDKAPLLALNESLVLNLCSMYELAFVHNVQTKKNLSEWIQQIAPNDFDYSCTRL